MTLPRDEVAKGIITELEAFGELVRSLSADELAAPSRCDGWTVGDVAAHVIGGQADVVAGRLDGLGSPEVTARQVDERRGRTADELADELDAATKATVALIPLFDDAAWAGPAPGGYDGTLGDGVEALWYDAYLHADDIRAAIGRPTVRTDGLRAGVSHVAFELTKRGWGPATLALDGMPEFDVGAGGRRIDGDAHEFVLTVTGRADPSAFGLDDSVNIYA